MGLMVSEKRIFEMFPGNSLSQGVANLKRLRRRTCADPGIFVRGGGGGGPGESDKKMH